MPRWTRDTPRSKRVQKVEHIPDQKCCRVELTRGHWTVIDESDLPLLQNMCWSFINGYAYNSRLGYLHRLIMRAPDGMCTDHISHDKLDNRRSNLRICTQLQNMGNIHKTKRPTTSKYKGVHRDRGVWKADISHKDKTIHLGRFDTEEDAARAYNGKALELRGEFAILNEVPA